LISISKNDKIKKTINVEITKIKDIPYLTIGNLKNQKITKNKFIKVRYKNGLSLINSNLDFIFLDLEKYINIKLIKTTKQIKGTNFFNILFLKWFS
tara:strand:+ start:332 stop:619 length:288 start_codon:yes stop_codon:yes gene_type:complete